MKFKRDIELVITKRTASGIPLRGACSACETEFSTEAFEETADYPHEAKLKLWFSDHFQDVHVEK